MAGATGDIIERARTKLLEGELGRRLVHASGSVLPLLFLVGVPWWGVQALFVVGVFVAALLEALRLYGNLDWRIFTYLTRDYEQDNPAGYMLYMFSSTVVVLVFEPRIAMPAVLMLTLGDPISGLTASAEFRRVKRPKSLATMGLVCVALSAPFLYDVPLAIALGSLGGMTADGVKPIVRGYIIDDNLTIAPVAATAMFAGVELTAALG